MKKVIRDPGYRPAKFIETLRKHGMRNVYEARVFPPSGARVLQIAPKARTA